ncbi:discoidin domain-containing protein [Catellatospora sp. KI3]|uniref:galactose-binding domain-containing protein n=1 Tax=Catellatospora sp. KI3 TaxID=3041620 RepID=UPI002482DAC5|nr:discoidin domain-containing protein [Catellatospora sp. KI3]MDI1462528.1 discoidin domain-containing protein [Catellatospora sp. KI3]
MQTTKNRRLRLVAGLVATGLMVFGAPALTAQAAGGPNLSLGKTASASSTNNGFVTGNLNDGNQGSYWEGTNNSFPQWAQIDLGAATSIDQVVLKLPANWEQRTQTLSVQGSTNGSTWSTLVNSAGYTFSPGSANTVTLNFTASSQRYVRVNITANTTWAAAQLSELEVYGAGTGTGSGNLAQGKATTESGHADVYGSGNTVDGNQGSYWESTNNAFPQWVRVDLGSAVSVNKVVAKLPSGWGARTQTITVQGSTDGTNFTNLVASTVYSFAPSANTVTINFSAATVRYVRLWVTANSAWPAAQISEFEVYGPTTGDTQAPSTPGSLAYTQPAQGQIKLTWNASTDNTGVTAYDVYANGALLTSVSGTTLTYTDGRPDSETVSYYVRARDAAGNQSGNSNTVTRTGQTGDQVAPTAPGSLAYTSPASGQIKLTWTASVDNVGVTNYDVYANSSLRATVAGNVLTYTDSQPDTATVSYFVRARDAAGNISPMSNTVTRNGSGGGGTNQALGKPVTDNGHTWVYTPELAVDGDLTTYWEGSTSPNQLTVALGSNVSLGSIVVKLNPDAAWGARTQTIQVLGREQSSSSFVNVVSAQTYSFNPASGNTVTIPASGNYADVRLQFTGNSGAPGGQVAEFQVIGVPAPNPDLTVTAATWSPASPIETDAITATATVKNNGTATAGATNVNFYLGTVKVGTANVASLAAGAQSNVSVSIGTQNAGTYALTAKVDESNAVVEQSETNNSYTNPTNLVVAPVQTSDLVAAAVAFSPSNPSAGNTVTFSVSIKNQGVQASASGAHGITLVLKDAATGATITTKTGSYSGVINAGATTSPVNLGTWTAVNGKYNVTTTIAVDGNELPVKQGNNTSTQGFFVGRGANLGYDMYEAEDGTTGGGAGVVGPNRTIGDLGGEASGRKAVTLNTNGAYVQWTTKADANALVTRFSIPDNSGGTGTTSTLNIYVNGAFHKAITLTSKHSWLYGAEAAPSNSPGAGPARHLYDEANILLDSTIPAGSTIKLQKDAANSGTFAIDFINLEKVSPRANPDPAHLKVPTGFTHQNVQDALDAVRMDTTGTWTGVYLPAGTYSTAQKLQVYGKPIKVTGAGMWYTRFETPTSQENTDAGFRVESSANGSTFEHLAFFGNYTIRQDGPGKVWGELKTVNNLTFDSVWVEHTVCGFWGVNVSGWTVKNSRIRDTFADGINLTNDSTNNLVTNVEGRGNGDDAFALFSATDGGGSVGNHGNVFENLSATLTWRAAGLAVYGGYDNTFRNMYIADMLTYSGITISSLDFGYPFVGFGNPPTKFENISLVRAGGHFWGNQTFGAIWVFAATHTFQAIRVTDVDIIDPTYSGIMFQSKYPEQKPVTDTIFTNVRISGAQKSGDAYDAKSGIGIWVNEMPEAGQGPAIGSATFTNLTFSNNFQNIRNTTTTFTITQN